MKGTAVDPNPSSPRTAVDVFTAQLPRLMRDTSEALHIAEEAGDDNWLIFARLAHGVALVHRDSLERGIGLDLLAKVRDAAPQTRLGKRAWAIVEVYTAAEKVRTGDLDHAIELSRAVLDRLFDSGEMVYRALAATVLVEALLARGGDADLREAHRAIDRLAAVPTDPGFVLHELPLLRLRALLARARGNEEGYRDYRDRHRTMAIDLGFDGHIAVADAMPWPASDEIP